MLFCCFFSSFVKFSSNDENAILVFDHCKICNNSQNDKNLFKIRNVNVQFNSVIFQGEWDASFHKCEEIDLSLTETKDKVNIGCFQYRSPNEKVKIREKGKNYSLDGYRTLNLEIQGADHILVYEENGN